MHPSGCYVLLGVSQLPNSRGQDGASKEPPLTKVISQLSMRSFIFTTGAAGAGSTHLSAGELKEMYCWTDPNSGSGVLGIFLISGPEGRSKPFEKEKLCIKKNPVQRTFPDECSGQHYLVLKSKLWGFMGISKAAVIPQTLCITSCLTQGFYSP